MTWTSDKTLYRLTVAYDGRAYFGWQRKPDTPTLQGTIEQALGRAFGDTGPAQGAGRTDRGVHAEGQVISVWIAGAVGADRLKRLNQALPDDIRALSLIEAPEGFHARTSATGKRYRYEIFQGQAVTPELDGRVWLAKRQLDPNALRAAACVLVGEHDFASFVSPTRTRKGKSAPPSTVRHLRRFDVSVTGNRITLVLEAESFLYKMVRNLVYAVAAVGEGRSTVDALKEALAAKNRKALSGTAPASGLYLDKVFYEEHQGWHTGPVARGATGTPAQVRWDRLKPRELESRLADCNIVWWPLGTLEWHGHHLPLGVDALLSEALMVRCAQRFGGVVLPPIHLGPDRSKLHHGEQLVGMEFDETTVPVQRLAGNAYWVSEALFDDVIDAQLVQLKRAGVKAVFADGHGPSRWRWAKTLKARSASSGLNLYGIDARAESAWPSQTDHAARNETSMMLAAYPELVDLAALDGPDGRLGVAGEDPRRASAEEGEACFEKALVQIAEMMDLRFKA